MGLITLPDGTQANIDKSNYSQLALKALGIYRSRGIAVDEAATNQAFLEAAGRDTAFQGALAGPGSVSVDFSQLGAVSAANDVAANPLVGASDTIFHAAPTSVQSIWSGASDGVITATDKVASAAKAVAEAAANNLPGALGQLNDTLKIAIVGGAVIAVAGAAIYIVMKFK